MTAPTPEGTDEPFLDLEQEPPGEHSSELPDGTEPGPGEEDVREENAGTSFPEPSQ